jgi:hypothetical protein
MARVAVGRLVLGTGAVVPISAGERLFVVAVEEGQLEVVTSVSGTAAQTSLTGGGETIVKIGADSTLRSAEDGPTTLLLFTIASAAVGRGDRWVSGTPG